MTACRIFLTAAFLWATPVHTRGEEFRAAPDTIMQITMHDGRSWALAKLGRFEVWFERSPVPVVPAGLAGDEIQDEKPVNTESPVPPATWPIEELLFGTDSGEGRRTRLDKLLEQRIADVDRACGLSAIQKQKLLLAGHGDVKRFVDRAAALKATFENDVFRDQNEFVEWAKRVMSLRGERDVDHFGTGSLFAKTLKRTLSRDQYFSFCQWRMTHMDEWSRN